MSAFSPAPRRFPRTASLLLSAIAFASPLANGQERASDSRARPIDAVLAHPPFDTWYACAEHAAGALPSVGDDLGQDCLVQAMPSGGGPQVMAPFKGDGSRNEDWYGWNRPVLSPGAGTVLRAQDNPVTNEPGQPGRPPAGFVLLRTADGTFFVVAHLQGLRVKQGDTVAAGQVLGQVGNNGYSRMPHIHVGAWRGRDALQIRWDQQKMPIDPGASPGAADPARSAPEQGARRPRG